MVKYSIIIPVFNRPTEVKELLESLALQEFMDFELILVEDGSNEKCDQLVEQFSDSISIKYFFKNNTGPGDSRNYGMEKAAGDFFLFFDSDCLLPKNYLRTLDEQLQTNGFDAFGGPDAAHDSFTDTQKAINYAMTSFITTGGIRGDKKAANGFQLRSFNMGLSREVYKQVGGFCNIHPGEDPDLSYRIKAAGFKAGLIPNAFVYHKRRIDFGKFLKQVYKFGMVRVVLNKWYPEKVSPVFFLPSLFLLGSLLLILLSIVYSIAFAIPFVALATIVLLDALIKTKSITIGLMAILATYLQLLGYGYGFLKSFWLLKLLKKDERNALPSFFFRK
ncbi:MAG: glycosyltransferase [Cyclobacteriaceae bacterium]